MGTIFSSKKLDIVKNQKLAIVKNLVGYKKLLVVLNIYIFVPQK
jgi:hypothetical protein